MDLTLHNKQSVAFLSEATEILYGGAAGGGKSHLMRVLSIVLCTEIAGLQVYLFRRVRDDLAKNHIEGVNGYRNMLAEWVDQELVELVGEEIRFWNGSKIYLCHCKDERDRFKYQGAEIHVLLIDELTHFSDIIYRFLRGRVRAIGLNVPDKYKGSIPRILCGSNPGNIGHNWVKSAFIDNVEPLEIRTMGDDEGGMSRQYIPARLDDNPSMLRDDPAYRQRLRGLGSKALVKAMEDGDWNVVEGAYFDCWSTEKHVIEPFEIPDHWIKARAFDWGFAKPFSVGWWAIANEEFTTKYGLYIQKGALIRFREWYGAKGDDVGIRLDAEDVGRGIREREQGENITYGVADPSIGKEDGGPSIRERMGISFRMGDNRRIAGWDSMRQRLKGTDLGPMIFCFSTCKASIRTIPSLQHCDKRPEDLQTSMEDHCFAAGTLIRTDAGDIPIESMQCGTLTTIAGEQLYCRGGLKIKNATTVRLHFSDGSNVVCTPDHKFLTYSGEWIEAIDMTGERSYAVMEGDSQCQKSSATLFKSLKASDTTCATNTSKRMVSDCTEQFGKKRMAGMFRKGSASITKIISELIMGMKTLFSWMILNTGVTTRSIADTEKKPSRSLDHSLIYGMVQKKGRSGTRSITKSIARIHSIEGSERHAYLVVQDSMDLSEEASSVQTSARRQPEEIAALIISRPHAKSAGLVSLNQNTVVSQRVQENVEANCLYCTGMEYNHEQDVYCLTVQSTGHFMLANGAVVANCADEWRYMIMSRPWTIEIEKPCPPIDAPVTFDQAIKHSDKMIGKESRKRI